MARWVLNCRNCGAEFTHNQISDTSPSVRDPFLSVAKPEFPVGGERVVCPGCKGTFVYQRYELVFQAA